jgi:hypothetical protein
MGLESLIVRRRGGVRPCLTSTFAGEFEDEPIKPIRNAMTQDMFVVFTLLAIVGSAFLGLLERSVPKGGMHAIVFLGFLWGIGFGSKFSDNELVIFLVFPIAITGGLFGLVHLIFPKFFPALGRAFLKDVDKKK